MSARKQVFSIAPNIQYAVLALMVALFFISVNVLFRPIFPIDETRYVSVAWEMWLDNNWLVPHINGVTYDHKPPFMFWLFSSIWALFGTSETVTRMVVPVFSLINLYLVSKLAQKVYPDSPQAKWLSPLILISFLGWFLYSGMIMFDLMLTVFIQLAVISVWKFAQTDRIFWARLSGVFLGLGMLTKGPVVFVYFIPFIALVRLWHPSPSRINKVFFKAIVQSVFIAIVVILAWAIPAAIAGGAEYAKAIFWGQSAGRIQDSFAHARPFYWYVMLLPALLFPWFFLTGFWRSRPWLGGERSDTFCLVLFVIVVAIFSCFSGKQIHYLFPVFPFAAIWVANRLSPEKFTTEPAVIAMLVFVAIAILSSPLWVEKVFRSAQITEVYQSWALLPVAFMALLLWKRPLPFERLALNIGALMLSLSALLASLSPILNNLYDVTDIGRHIHQLQAKGASVSFVGKYHNTFGYAGKLEAPLNLIPGSKEVRDACLSTEPGYTVWIQRKKTDPLAENAVYMTPFRGKWLFIMDNQMLEKVLQENQTNNLVVAEDS
ncbi:glycosyltransferase family 39 protein [Vibrio fluvialis]|nr:glycosyltransferase family 39 protein [Vibrio fluvialis]